MKSNLASLLGGLLFSGCLGDNRGTVQSPPEPTRFVAMTSASSDLRRSSAGDRQFAPGRVYEITRLASDDQPWGQWRAAGESIREHGSSIEFRELGSGRMISFIAPHQITPTSSLNTHAAAQFRDEGRNEAASL